MLLSINNHGVIPAQTGIHLEIAPQPQGGAIWRNDLLKGRDISGWIPAFAGMTSCFLKVQGLKGSHL